MEGPDRHHPSRGRIYMYDDAASRKSDNTDALLKALPGILPVAVRTLADGSQEIISK